MLCNLAMSAAGPADPAAAFGARPSALDVSLSPDGKSIAYVVPAGGAGSVVYTVNLEAGGKPKAVMAEKGKPERLLGCDWVSNDRLACRIYAILRRQSYLLPADRLVAVNADGSNMQQLSSADRLFHRVAFGGGSIVDWLPEQDGMVLMSRAYTANANTGSMAGSTLQGLGVDLLDTRSLRSQTVELPATSVAGYIGDGHGLVRIMVLAGAPHPDRQSTGIFHVKYRTKGAHEWQQLGDFNSVDHTGFNPVAIDSERNVVYGFKKLDGREALYTVALDGSLHEELVYSRPDVDVDGLIRIGRRHRVVGVSYDTDVRHAVYFDADIKNVVDSLRDVLPQHPAVRVVDASFDEGKLLVLASRDSEPGTYYLFDRKLRQLRPLLEKREQLDGLTLASVKPVTYPATDGTQVPGYLTYPPGKENSKGLPAIVMPHGGPDARDEWGFDWLAQFFAARGFVVLQPEYRGSGGFGDTWRGRNGFRSWPIAIGDVLDAGRWLTAQGIAQHGKLAIVGWSYGGYAALQAAVVDPQVYQAVVAIAPVTDLEDLKNEWAEWSNFNLTKDFIGDGPLVREGSPARNAGKIKVPVLLFHGAIDRNVSIDESRHMAESLKAAGVPHELVTWDDLDHQLDDSNARADLLRKSDAFLRHAFGE
jgi:dipeptidyl aminopeptidase/acylaminoacyl peptidase